MVLLTLVSTASVPGTAHESRISYINKIQSLSPRIAQADK